MSNYPYRLLAPGPVPVPPAVLKKMSEKVIHHRTPEFEKILIETWEGLKYVFQTKQPVQILCGTGSLAMEAAVVNLISPGDEVLVIVGGKFGERWAEICARYGAKVHALNIEWGHAASASEVYGALQQHTNIKVVFAQACETSTATKNDIQDIAAVVKKFSTALFAVDAITAVGCMPLPMDQWGLDCVVAGSQKAFMIPTGLSFIALSDRAWKAQAAAKTPKFYLDLALEKKANSKNETHFSTPTPLIIGLNEVLKQIRSVGLERVIARCQLLSEVTFEIGESFGLKTYSGKPSPSVTALTTPSDSTELREWLERERSITVMGGQDQLKGKILRVGHMGDVRDEDMLALFDALDAKLGWKGDPQQKEARRTQIAERLAKVPPLFP